MSHTPSEKGTPPSELATDKASDRQIEDAVADLNFDNDKTAERCAAGVTSEDAYNPLRRLDKTALLAEADNFVDKFGLTEHRDVFRRGALVAQRPKEYADIPELSDADKADLAFEENHMWKNLSPRLIFCGTSP